MAPTIDTFFLRSSASPPDSAPPARSRKRASTASQPAASKKTTTARTPKLKKLTEPKWEDYSMEAPTTPNAQKCIEKWGLLAPFDPKITEKQWSSYFEERSAVEKRNISGTEEYKALKWEELMQRPDRLLKEARRRLVGNVLGSCAEKRPDIVKTIEGSLYYLSLWGCEEDGSDDSEERTDFMPRQIAANTRLYSPFGLGTSIDFRYYYYNHHFRADQQYLTLVMSERDIASCTGTQPFECSASMTGRGTVGPPAEGSTRLFYWDGGKSTKGITAPNLLEMEIAIFGSGKWISPRMTFNLLASAGTVGIYQECLMAPVSSVRNKFKLFENEVEDMHDNKTAQLKAA